MNRIHNGNGLLFATYNQCKFQDSENCREIKLFQSELEKCREGEQENIVKNVSEICRCLEILKLDILRTECGKLNTEVIRKKLVEMEEKIVNLKTMIKEKLIETLVSESSYKNDLKLLENRMADWEKTINVNILRPIKLKSSLAKNTNTNIAVTEFENFISCNGGHYGGWMEQDHLLFLRERKKKREKDKFFNALQYLLPDMSYNDIIEHENWYLKYEDLKNLQREAIKKWKTEKLNKQDQNLENENKPKKETSLNEKSRNEKSIKERIKEWKKQQLERKLKEEEQQKEERKRLKEEQKKMKEIQISIKKAVDEYKIKKLNKMKTDFLEEPKYKKYDKEKSSILMKSFRLEDIKFIEKKKIIRLQLESQNKSKIERLRGIKPLTEFIVPRDPARIFKPTIIWNQHCQAEVKNDNILNVYDLNSIQHFAIPEWRKELK